MLRGLAQTLINNLCLGRDEISVPRWVDLSEVQSFVDNMINIKERPEGYYPRVRYKEQFDIVVLVSGGLDSTIAYFLTKKKYPNLRVGAIYVKLGEACSYSEKELEALEQIGIPYVLEEVFVPKPSLEWEHIVPSRNFLLLVIASEYLRQEGRIIFSSVSGEVPREGGDKSLRFYSQAKRLLERVEGKQVVIETLKDHTKAEWIEIILDMYSDEREEMIEKLKQTVSCFSTSQKHCGTCRACFRRFVAFETAGIDVSDMFEVHPMIGCRRFVQEYKKRMGEALERNDFSYFTKERCIQTLQVIRKWEETWGSF